MTQLTLVRRLAWLISWSIVCGLTQLNAQTVGLREDLNRDAQLQALQQVWDGHDVVRMRRLLKEVEPAAGTADHRSFPWYYYNYLANQMEVIRGVQGGFSGVAISPDNQVMLALGNEQVDVWDLRTQKKIGLLATHPTDHANFSSDSRLVAFCSRTIGAPQKRLDVFDLKSHERVASFAGADYATFSSDRTLLAVVNEKNIELRSTVDWQVVRKLDSPVVSFNFVEFSGDSQYFAASCRDEQVRVWRVSDGAQLFSLPIRLADQVAFIDNPCRLLVVERGSGVRAWSVPEGTELSMFQGKPRAGGGGGAMFISHDQKFLVTAVPYSNIAWIEVWDLKGGRLLRKLELGDVRFDMCLLGKSNRLALATNQGQLEVWNLETLKREESSVVERERMVIVGQCLDSDTEGNLYWASRDTVSIFRSSAVKAAEVKRNDSASNTVRPSSMWWPTATGLDVGDFATGAVRHIDIQGPANLNQVALSLDGQKAIGGIGQGKIAVWSDLAQPPFVIDLQLNQVDRPNRATINKLALSPSAKYMAVEGPNVPLQVWDLQSRVLVKSFSLESRRRTLDLAISDQPVLANLTQTESNDKEVELWKIDAAEPRRLQTDKTTLGCLFSLDSQWLVTTGGPAYKIWNYEDGKVLAEQEIKAPWTDRGGKAVLAFVPGKSSAGKISFIIGERGGLQEIEALSGTRMKSFSPRYWTDEDWNLVKDYKRQKNSWSIDDERLMLISVSGDGQRLMAQVGDGRIFQWNMADSRGTLFVERPRPAQAISQDHSGQRLIAAETSILTYGLGSGQWQPVASVKAPQAVMHVARSGDLVVATCKRQSQHRQTSSSNNESGLWSVHTLNARTGEQIRQFDFASGIHAIAMSPDQKLLAIGALEMEQTWQMIHLCRADTGEVLAKLKGRVDQLHFSPDGQQLFGAIQGDHPLVMPTTELSNQLWKKQFSKMTMAGPASRQKLLAFGLQTGEIEIWDYGTGKALQTLHGHPGEIIALEFTADGRYLASSGSDNRVCLWSLATGLQVWSQASDKPIRQLQFDESGQNLGIRTADNSFQVLRGKP